ncbi:MAG: ABC transporter ATP-binding protein [Candidatus Bathyarchaeota archaeon]|nr:ABC transporter ATP-binding protein [Candidatus Bathyarchaeota archaeon]
MVALGIAASIIQATKLVKSFGKSLAINQLDLQVPNGISGFVGRNGAGKTTTIGVLLGLLKPGGGEATVFGLDCWQDSFQIRRRLGVMHEINAYPGGFTAKRLLQHVARIYGVTQADQRIAQLLAEVGLADAKDKPIKAYSAGMTRRLGLAQALLSEPEFAILDEPTANIDPLGRIALLEKIKEMNKDHGTGFLISTHILSDLEKVCSWLSIIDGGRLVDQGSVTDLAAKYSANVYKIGVSEPAVFLAKLQELPIVKKAWIEGDNVFCQVQDPTVFYSEIPKIASNLNLQLKNFQHMVGTLEEIYTRTAGGT